MNYITVKEAAEMAGCTQGAIWSRMYKGRLPYKEIDGVKQVLKSEVLHIPRRGRPIRCYNLSYTQGDKFIHKNFTRTNLHIKLGVLFKKDDVKEVKISW